MLFHLFDYLEQQYDFPGASLFQFISFRAALAIIISLIISLLMGGRIIGWIKRRQMLEKQRALGLPGEELKAKTPTMGGILIHMAIILPCLLLADLSNVYIQLMLLSTVWMGTIGFIDDYFKLTRSKAGLSGKYKILGQVVLGGIVGATMLFHSDVVVRVNAEQLAQGNYEVIDTVQVQLERLGDKEELYYVKSTMTNVPFFKGNELDYTDFLWFLGDNAPQWVWLLFIPFVILIVTARIECGQLNGWNRWFGGGNLRHYWGHFGDFCLCIGQQHFGRLSGGPLLALCGRNDHFYCLFSGGLYRLFVVQCLSCPSFYGRYGQFGFGRYYCRHCDYLAQRALDSLALWNLFGRKPIGHYSSELF